MLFGVTVLTGLAARASSSFSDLHSSVSLLLTRGGQEEKAVKYRERERDALISHLCSTLKRGRHDLERSDLA